MKPPSGGNGSGKFYVVQDDVGGWVRVHAAKLASVPDDLGYYLSHALTEWFRQRPHLRVCSVIGVVRGGSTVELHAWYTMHAFPDLALPCPQGS